MEEQPEKPRRWNSLIIGLAILALAVILIMAILYVMLIPPGPWQHHTPAGTFQEVETDSPTEAHITFGLFTEDVKSSEIEIYVLANGTQIGHISWIDENTVQWIDGTSTSHVEFVYSDSSIYIMSGDMLEFSGLEPGTTYELEFLHLPTRTCISMTGADNVFATPYTT